MKSGWTCWFCNHKNDDEDDVCKGACDSLPKSASDIRHKFGKMFPGAPHPLTQLDCKLAVEAGKLEYWVDASVGVG